MTKQESTHKFAEALIKLGHHMLEHGLSRPANVGWQGWYHDDDADAYTDTGLDVQLWEVEPAELAAWARTLTDVTSNARRISNADGSLHAYVFGLLAGVPVRVWTSIPGDAFPDEPGFHEWDVTALLQEA